MSSQLKKMRSKNSNLPHSPENYHLPFTFVLMIFNKEQITIKEIIFILRRSLCGSTVFEDLLFKFLFVSRRLPIFFSYHWPTLLSSLWMSIIIIHRCESDVVCFVVDESYLLCWNRLLNMAMNNRNLWKF